MNRRKAVAIGQVIERELGVPLMVLRSKARNDEHVVARSIFVAILQTTNAFRSRTAATYLNRTQGQVNYIRRQHATWIQVDSDYRETFERVRLMCKNNLPYLTESELLSLKIQTENEVRRLRRQVSAIETELRRRHVKPINQ